MDIYQKTDPAADDRLNLLMIGNSGCYYHVEELYGMLEAAGIPANVCNVYYDGCKLSQHWTWWKNKEAHYQYFITNENGRVKAGEGVDLEWCLQQHNWDMISLQAGGFASIRTVSTEDAIGERAIYLKELYGYLREQFPMSPPVMASKQRLSGRLQPGICHHLHRGSAEGHRDSPKFCPCGL